MTPKAITQEAMTAAATTVLVGVTRAAEGPSLDEVIAKLRDKDAKIRAEAWPHAASFGPSAIKLLSPLLADPETEVTRAAKRALSKIVHQAGRPGAASERKAAIQGLVPFLAAGHANVVRREILWLLSEIGGDESVQPAASLLVDNELREDARMVLQRIPGNRSLAALKSGLAAAPEDFKPNIAESLRKRGVTIRDYPSQKLVPRKGTTVKPAQQI